MGELINFPGLGRSAETAGFAGPETPALLVDEAILETNLAAAAALARDAGVALRPHWKTHKCFEIARRQIELGAVGGTVAKAGEAEVFLEAGFDDLVIATPVVDPRKIRRLIGLAAERGATLCPLVESDAGRKRWSDAAEAAGVLIPVLLEIDVGMGRTGVGPGPGAVGPARAIAGSPGLELRGILTHAGHAYGAATSEEVAAIGRAEGETMAATAEVLRAAGLPCSVVSVGSTPTVPHSAGIPGVTEIRPGNSVFHDAIQVALGVVPESRCALTVLATVTARPAPDRVVLDCGSKTLSSDTGVAGGAVEGFGRVLGRFDRIVRRLSEEHGIVPVAPDDPLAVGDLVRVLPNHACATSNLHDRFLVLRAGEPVAEWAIAARGRVG